ncbi:hypothetical protein CsSME_00033584 [Camellia sinensis var. sinensis]
MGSTTSDRNRRKPSFIVFSDDEDDDDTKKLAKPEPKKQELEPEPSQPHHYMAHVPDDIMSAILSRNPWKSISRLQCVSLYWQHARRQSLFAGSMEKTLEYFRRDERDVLDKSGSKIIRHKPIIALLSPTKLDPYIPLHTAFEDLVYTGI